jgi:hypothetical protein
MARSRVPALNFGARGRTPTTWRDGFVGESGNKKRLPFARQA